MWLGGSWCTTPVNLWKCIHKDQWFLTESIGHAGFEPGAARSFLQQLVQCATTLHCQNGQRSNWRLNSSCLCHASNLGLLEIPKSNGRRPFCTTWTHRNCRAQNYSPFALIYGIPDLLSAKRDVWCDVNKTDSWPDIRLVKRNLRRNYPVPAPADATSVDDTDGRKLWLRGKVIDNCRFWRPRAGGWSCALYAVPGRDTEFLHWGIQDEFKQRIQRWRDGATRQPEDCSLWSVRLNLAWLIAWRGRTRHESFNADWTICSVDVPVSRGSCRQQRSSLPSGSTQTHVRTFLGHHDDVLPNTRANLGDGTTWTQTRNPLQYHPTKSTCQFHEARTFSAATWWWIRGDHI